MEDNESETLLPIADTNWQVGTEKVRVHLPWFDLCTLPIETPEKHRATYHTMTCGDWVKVVTIDHEGKFVMVDQFRPVNESYSLEVPGGTVEESDPTPEAAALRELREETGYVSSDSQYLGWIYSNAAIFSNRCHVILARGATKQNDQALEPGESMHVELLTRAELIEAISSGRIRHGLVLAALLKVLLQGT